MGALQRQQGRIPKNERELQLPLDEKLRSDPEWQSAISQLVAGIIFISQQIGGSLENGMNHNKENGKISNGGEDSLSDPSAFFARILLRECRAHPTRSTPRHHAASCG